MHDTAAPTALDSGLQDGLAAAQTALGHGDLSAALGIYSELRRRFRGKPEPFQQAAAALLDAGHYDEADLLLEVAQERFPADPTLAFDRARVAHRRGDPAEALRHWERMRRTFPDHPGGYTGAIATLRDDDQPEAANALLRSAVARFPDDADLLAEAAAHLQAYRAAPEPVVAPEPEPLDPGLRRVDLSALAVTLETLVDATDFSAPAEIVYTNFPILDPVAGKQHLNELYVAREHHMEAITLGRLPAETDLIVAGGEDFIPVHDGRLLGDQVPAYWAAETIPDILNRPRPQVGIDGSAVLIARFGLRTWGHWLAELLPKMICVEAAYPGKHRFVLPAAIFSDPVLRPLLESIWYHGIDLARIVPVMPDTVYRFGELYAVSSVWSGNKLHPGVAALVRARMRPVQPNMPRKVAFLRTESETRNIANIQAVTALLKRQGFTMVEIGALPFADQVATFASAETIVSVLGSGLAGLLYAPQGVRMLTLAPSRWWDLFFFALLQTRDGRLADIRGVQDPTDSRAPAIARFVVELAEIQKGLKALGV